MGELNREDNAHDKVVDFTRKTAVEPVIGGIKQAIDVEVSEKIKVRSTRLTQSIFHRPKAMGWLVVILGIAGAAYAIVQNSPQPDTLTNAPPTPEIISSPTSSTESEQSESEPDQDKENSEQNCRVRNSGERSWEALALDATDAIQSTQYRGKISFSQTDCTLVAKVLTTQPLGEEEKQQFQNEITNLVRGNLAPDIKENEFNIDFQYL
ncbi:MAG: hypothetical protein F6K42_01715 [Leptolyngbya sp. SIO1D8]|nr:hypothetical protein [Leptolyngbya sp. SIO1D8]